MTKNSQIQGLFRIKILSSISQCRVIKIMTKIFQAICLAVFILATLSQVVSKSNLGAEDSSPALAQLVDDFIKDTQSSSQSKNKLLQSYLQHANILNIQKLTPAKFNSKLAFNGYIYNVELKKYLNVDSTPRWIYANADDRANAVFFTLQRTQNGSVVIQTLIGNMVYFLNWRELSGAVKLYDTYDSMELHYFENTDFRIYSNQQTQYMGTKEGSSDNEMYYRKAVFNYKFEFHIVPHAEIFANPTKVEAWNKYITAYSERASKLKTINTVEDSSDPKLHRIKISSPEKKQEL